MIVETTDNRYYLVHETGNPDLAHVWLGTEVRWVKGKNRFERRSSRGGRRPQLVSKAHCLRIVVPACET